MKIFWFIFFSSFLCLIGCKDDSRTVVTVEQEEIELRALLNVPDHFALPPIPDYNKPTTEKIDLGRHLFYDRRLSGNQTQSCADCHLQLFAFADGLVTPAGSTGDVLVRNSQGLGNAMYHATLTWANDAFFDLEQQLQVPIRSDNPIELGVTEATINEVLARFDNDPMYVEKLAVAFPDSTAGANITKIIHALASFCRTLISGNSPYDQYLQGDDTALTEQQKFGLQLFNGEKFECFHCHNGINFTSSYRDYNSNPSTQTFPFFNNGLYNVNSAGDYPAQDQGLFDLTQRSEHRGKFRPQSLRNVAVTPPYMHDGSIATLREVVEHYANGGRVITEGIYAGDGRTNPLKSGFIRGFNASGEEIDAVVAFLESLTDEDFLTNPAFSDPFDN